MPEEESVSLADGRTLTYTDSGPVEGKPVIAFHGTPGSRLEHAELSILDDTHTRLITVDRPGYGKSDFCEPRTLLDWPDDVIQLADALDLDRFAVMGFSGGGPYAAACGYKIPERITCTTLLSSLAPFDVPQLTDGMLPANLALFHMAAQDYRQAEQQLIELVDTPESLFHFIEASAASVDQQIFSDSGFRAMYMQNMHEVCRQGLRGMAYDMAIVAKPWGFDPAEISTPVVLWHGTADANVPVTMGNYLAQGIPNCQATFVPDTGHYLMFRYWREILQRLMDYS